MLTHNEMIIRNLKNNAIDDFMTALNMVGTYYNNSSESETDYTPTRPIATDIINKWYEAKKPLIDMFSHHPNYNREYGYILLSTEYDRPKDYATKNSFLWWFNTAAGLNRVQYEAVCELLYPCEQYVESDDTAEVIKQVFNVPCGKGVKVMKTVNKIAASLGVDHHEEWGKMRAKLGDAITPQKVTRPTILSVNPVDFLTMSTDLEHNEAYRSCYNIHDGEYSGGVMGYLLDPSTVVLYTLDADASGSGFRINRAHFARKISRQLFHIGEEKIIQSRFYNSTDYKGARALVQRVYAECNNVPNYWIMRRDKARHYADVIDNGYVDILRSYSEGDHGCVSFLAPSTDCELNEELIYVGVEQIICPNCGERHNNTDSILCESCQESPDCACYDCGLPLYSYNALYIDGRYFCCDSCAESAGYHFVTFCGRNEWYYESELDYCQVSERWIHEDDTFLADDGTVFEDLEMALENGYVQTADGQVVPYEDARLCDECGMYHLIDDTNTVAHIAGLQGDVVLCDDCLRDAKERGKVIECEHCGGLYFPEDCDESVVEAGYCREDCATAAGYVVAGVA